MSYEKSNCITPVDKEEYFVRLIKKNRIHDLFILDYLYGNGNELSAKFWSTRSSSRLAFDLYSWIVEKENVKYFKFEYKLPGVITSKSGSSGVPNLDVYFEIDNNIVFIENKYTEKSDFKYLDLKRVQLNGEKAKPKLSEAYYLDNKYGFSKLTLTERFYDNERIGKLFSTYCYEINEVIEELQKKDKKECAWFDAKQETCHLFGIIFYLLGTKAEHINKRKEELRNKKITLCHIFWKMEKDNDSAEFPILFKEKAEKLINEILENNGFYCKFEFKILTVQNLIEENVDFFGLSFKDAYAYGTTTPLKDQMVQYKITTQRS